MLKIAPVGLPDGAWLDEERRLLQALGEDPATAPLVPRVLHQGRFEGRPFFALERFPATAADLLDRPLPERLTLALRLAEVAARLRQARPALVHRDIKPSNVLVDGGRVVITDLGISREAGPGRLSTTRAQLTVGYAAPEQSLPHRRPEPSWDLFGLAATLYHIVVGEPAEAPGQHPWRLTERGRQLRAGQDEGRGEAWEYLDLASQPGLSPRDRARLDALVEGPLRDALLQALAPDARARRGSPSQLADALRRSRPRAEGSSGRRPGRSPSIHAMLGAGLLGAGLLGAGLLGAGLLGAGLLRQEEAFPAPPPSAPPYPMVTIPAGEAEGIAGIESVEAFEMGRTEVDQGLWEEGTGRSFTSRRKLTDEGPAEACTRFGSLDLEGERMPMVCVDFYDTLRFANALSERHGLQPAYRLELDPLDQEVRVHWDPEASGYRLPTVAEWRLAVSPLEASTAVDPCAENVRDASMRRIFPEAEAEDCDDGWPGPSPVGSFPPGPRGLFDGEGNVSEWLWDEAEGGLRGIGGGQWADQVSTRPRAFAGAGAPGQRWQTLGFRLARSRP